MATVTPFAGEKSWRECPASTRPISLACCRCSYLGARSPEHADMAQIGHPPWI